MKKKMLRVALLAVLASAIVAFRTFDLGRYLSLEALKANQAALDAWYQSNPLVAVLAYVAVYIAVTAASLPGAAILTLAGGALFGVWVGTAAVSVASTIGATLAFLAARFILRESVAARFQSLVAKVDDGVRKEGAFYLLSLRLIPLFPFFAINLVFGLTKMRTLTFFFVSQVGMLLGTIAYVNAGTQLASLTSLRGILSPRLLGAFVFLGIVPLVAKFVVGIARRRRAFGKFSRPKKYDYNVVVLGAGSAGLVSAYIAAAVKAKVALIEKHKMGGDCLNTGCVPSKALIRSAKVLADAKKATELGFSSIDVQFDFAKVMERVHRVIRTIEPHDSIARYTQLGVDCLSGTGKITSPFTVEVNGRTLTTKNIIVATGAKPIVPALPGFDTTKVWTSDSLWEMRTLPARILVLGGGPIGCELAQCFARFGSKVTIVERGERLLPREDRDVSQLLQNRFAEEGIQLRLAHEAKAITEEGGKKFLVCGSTRIEFDEILVALGRRGNTTGFGLEALGIEVSPQGTIEADGFLRTSVPNIFVCGDVAGPFQFTHVAAHQAWYASVNALFQGLRQFRADYRVIPRATFTDPEVARVGLNEQEATKLGVAFEVTRYEIDDLDRAIADERAEGFVKVLTEKGNDRILGATIVGGHAADFLVEYVAAMKHGFGLNKILGTIHTYPTMAEANKYTAGVWKKAHAPAWALRRLERFHAWRRNAAFLPF